MCFDKNIIYYVILNQSDIISNEKKKTMYLLEKVLNLFNVKMPKVYYTEYGKPYFKNSNIYFNCSHSENYIALAIANTPLGVDIEEDRGFTDRFSNIYLDSARGENKLKTFVLKEACSKLDGRGIRIIKDIKLNSIKSNYKYFNNHEYICCIVYDGNIKEFVDLSDLIEG